MLLTRTPLYSPCGFLVRLACVKRAASVDSEPGSNSRLNRCKLNLHSFLPIPSRLQVPTAPAFVLRSGLLLKVSDEITFLRPIRFSKIYTPNPTIFRRSNSMLASKGVVPRSQLLQWTKSVQLEEIGKGPNSTRLR